MIPIRQSITPDDIKAVTRFLESGSPLSGYLAGNPWGGAAVQRLEEMWCTRFNRRHAICCNSATSGLLAACVALGVKRGMTVGVPALSMSATAAVPAFCGGSLRFLDSNTSGGISKKAAYSHSRIDVVIGTTLWGHPIDRRWENFPALILDNAQGILSNYDDGVWSENLAHISVTSLNVHKQINAGEMGIISCDDAHLANTMRMFINHGENAASGSVGIGLNLRPTEISAILALSQMARIEETISRLDWLAKRLDDHMPSGFIPIHPRDGTRSARYCYAFQVPEGMRDVVILSLLNDGVPCSAMYSPIYHLPAFAHYSPRYLEPDGCAVAEHISKSTIIFELCAWRYEDDIIQVGDALQKAAKL